jgi:hypothetical protein
MSQLFACRASPLFTHNICLTSCRHAGHDRSQSIFCKRSLDAHCQFHRHTHTPTHSHTHTHTHTHTRTHTHTHTHISSCTRLVWSTSSKSIRFLWTRFCLQRGSDGVVTLPAITALEHTCSTQPMPPPRHPPRKIMII